MQVERAGVAHLAQHAVAGVEPAHGAVGLPARPGVEAARRIVLLGHPGQAVARAALPQGFRRRGEQAPAVPAPPPPRLDEQRADLAPRLRAQWAVGGDVGRARGDEPDRPLALGRRRAPPRPRRPRPTPRAASGPDRCSIAAAGTRSAYAAAQVAVWMRVISSTSAATAGRTVARAMPYGYRIPGDRIRWPWQRCRGDVDVPVALDRPRCGVRPVGLDLPGQPLRAPVRATAARGRVPVPDRRRAAGRGRALRRRAARRSGGRPRSSAPPRSRASCCPRGATAWSWSPSRACRPGWPRC